MSSLLDHREESVSSAAWSGWLLVKSKQVTVRLTRTVLSERSFPSLSARPGRLTSAQPTFNACLL